MGGYALAGRTFRKAETCSPAAPFTRERFERRLLRGASILRALRRRAGSESIHRDCTRADYVVRETPVEFSPSRFSGIRSWRQLPFMNLCSVLSRHLHAPRQAMAKRNGEGLFIRRVRIAGHAREAEVSERDTIRDTNYAVTTGSRFIFCTIAQFAYT